MNLAFRDIRHNRGRFLLTCLGLSLLLGVVMSMVGIYRGLVADALGIARAPAVDLWVVEAKRRGPFAEASRIPGDTREAIARIAGVKAAGSVTYQSVEARFRDRPLRLYVIGFEPGRPGGPRHLVAGRPVTQARYEMIADTRSGLALGDVVAMGRGAFRVVGLTTGQVASGGDPVAYVTLRDAQKLQFDLTPPAQRREQARDTPGSSSDIVNAVVATLIPNASAESVGETIRRWKHLNALMQDEQEAILSRSVVDMARRQLGLFTSILLSVSAVIIALIIYTLTIDKLREIATLKLIGAPDGVIVGLIVQQALAMGVIGFGLGLTLILAIKDRFPRRVVIEAADIGILALVILAVCVVASGLGVRLALKVDPAKALGG